MGTTFTIKNLKVCEWASEETTCFTATLYANGKRVGEVSNDGHGGAHRYGFNERQYAQLAHEWLWNDHIDFCEKYGKDKGDEATFIGDFDGLIDELVREQQDVKDAKSLTNRLAKKYPSHADRVRVYRKSFELVACFADTDAEKEIIAEGGVLAPTEAKLVVA